METWKPDPTFYPSPRMAMKAAPETFAYVVAFDPTRAVPDELAVVDVDPTSASYGQIINKLAMPNVGDELHHFGWNACSSCLLMSVTNCIISAGMPVRPVCARTRRTRTLNAAIWSCRD